jgi:hypothetical protein
MRARNTVAVLTLLAALVVVVSIHADTSRDPHQPIAIPYDQSVAFTLSGNHAGEFAYYSIDYPGDGSVITIEVDMAPGDPVAVRGAGFNVYGPNGYFIGCGGPSEEKTDRKVLQWSDYNPAQWLIQVYNYLDDALIGFDLRIEGLPDSGPSPTPTPEPVMLPFQARTFSMASDNLLGNRGGNYHYYYLESSGDDEQVTLELYYAPDNHIVSRGFGLNVYGPDGVQYAHGGHEISFKCPVAGSYLVQVYNYLHAINIHYVLNHRE